MITGNGLVGINAPDPQYLLHVGGTGYFDDDVIMAGSVGIGNSAFPEKLSLFGRLGFTGDMPSTTNFNTIARVGNGSMEVGASWSPNQDLAHNLGSTNKKWGNIYAYNAFIQTSDKREKMNIESLSYGLKEVLKLRPVSYEWIKTPHYGKKLGFIAQEIQEVIDEVVNDKEWVQDDQGKVISKPADRLGIAYTDLIPVLTKAIQEQQAIIEKQKEILASFETRMAKLEAKLSESK